MRRLTFGWSYGDGSSGSIHDLGRRVHSQGCPSRLYSLINLIARLLCVLVPTHAVQSSAYFTPV